MEDTIDVREEQLQYMVYCNLVELAQLKELNTKMQSCLEKFKKRLESKS
jgi:hypothetical protein